MSAPTAADPIALLAVEDPELLLDAVTVTEPDGTITAVNRGFTRLHGYVPSEVIGRDPRMLSSGLQSPDFIAQLWRTITSGHPWEGELVDRAADGTLRTIHSRITPVRGPGGQITHFVAVQRQIGAIGHGPSIGQLRVDHHGRCSYADAQAASLLRRDDDEVELLGGGLLGSMHVEDAAVLREVIEQAHVTGRTHHVDVAGADGYVRCTVTVVPGSRRFTAGPVAEIICAPLAAATG